ncbi:MAG: hypothetical protein AAF223_13075, partial [Bacteroidota bacterium]
DKQIKDLFCCLTRSFEVLTNSTWVKYNDLMDMLSASEDGVAALDDIWSDTLRLIPLSHDDIVGEGWEKCGESTINAGSEYELTGKAIYLTHYPKHQKENVQLEILAGEHYADSMEFTLLDRYDLQQLMRMLGIK